MDGEKNERDIKTMKGTERELKKKKNCINHQQWRGSDSESNKHDKINRQECKPNSEN